MRWQVPLTVCTAVGDVVGVSKHWGWLHGGPVIRMYCLLVAIGGEQDEESVGSRGVDLNEGYRTLVNSFHSANLYPCPVRVLCTNSLSHGVTRV